MRSATAVCWAAAVGLGLLQTWAGRAVMSPDGISYLDQADAWLRGDWTTALNAQWSPLYPWLLAVAKAILKPQQYSEFTFVHLVSFFIYLCALGCFEFFLRQLIAYRRVGMNGDSASKLTVLSELSWRVIGYAFFIWSSTTLISVATVTPDVLVSAFAYLATGIILRIRTGQASRVTFVMLGLVLGLGYLAKAPMLPLGFIYLGISVFAAGSSRRVLPRVLAALVIFLAISGPFIFAISHAKGRFTFGDSARLNYSWYLNETTRFVHWQGEDPRYGTPAHPTRKLLDSPPIYEFGTPLVTTYPPWYDPSYWYEGIQFHPSSRGLVRALRASAEEWWQIFFRAQRGLIVLLLLLLYVSCRRWSCLKRVSTNWPLLVPALAAFIMFSPVNLTARYVAPFVVLFCMGLLASVRLANSDLAKRLFAGVTIGAVALMTIGAAASMGREIIDYRKGPYGLQRTVAEDLNRRGVNAGDKVASIGDSFRAYWARLARVHIVAEIPSKGPFGEITAGDDTTFWNAAPPIRAKAIETLRTTGAKAIVTDRLPSQFDPSGWQRIAETNYYVFLLR